MKLRRSSGIVLHPTSLPSGRLGARRLRVRRLARGRGAELVAVLPLGPPDEVGSPYASPPPRSPPGTASSPSPDAPVTRASGRVPERQRVLDRGLGGGRRQRRRPGPLRARVVGAARLRRRARRAPDRRRPDLRRPGAASTTARTRALPATALVAGAPPDRLGAARPALGQPALRLGRGRARRLPLVDRAPAPDARALRPDPDRPLPRLRRVLGDPEGRTDARAGPLAAGPGRGAVRGGRARARSAARDRRGPRPDHARRDALRDRLGFPGMVVLLWAFQGEAGQPAPASRTTASSR